MYTILLSRKTMPNGNGHTHLEPADTTGNQAGNAASTSVNDNPRSENISQGNVAPNARVVVERIQSANNVTTETTGLSLMQVARLALIGYAILKS